MKLNAEVKHNVEVIDETPEGQQNTYRLILEGEGYKIVISGGEPFSDFKASMPVSVTIATPQKTLA